MILNEQIYRIKTLMYEQPQNLVVTEGNINDPYGQKIQLLTPDNQIIGYISIVSMGNAHKIDYDIFRLYNEPKWCIKNCKNDFFNNDNTTYLYDLFINENFRGKGFGDQIVNYAQNLIKYSGFFYNTLITDRTNIPAQNLYKKLGYDLHITDNKKDFYFVKL